MAANYSTFEALLDYCERHLPLHQLATERRSTTNGVLQLNVLRPPAPTLFTDNRRFLCRRMRIFRPLPMDYQCGQSMKKNVRFHVTYHMYCTYTGAYIRRWYVGEDGRQKWEVEHTLQHVYSRLKTGEVWYICRYYNVQQHTYTIKSIPFHTDNANPDLIWIVNLD